MDERKMILKMIEDGKITAEEGVKLLEAIGKGDSSAEDESSSTELTTKVRWDEGEKYRERARRATTSTANFFTSFIEDTIQKIKDVDLDFNFGTSISVDHIFQHRDISPKSIDLSLENGSIFLKPWDEPDVRIECEAKVYRVKDTDEARRYFLQQSTFQIDQDHLLFKTDSKSMKVEVTVYVPTETYNHIKLYTFNGHISGEKLTVHTLDANALNGPLSFTNVKVNRAVAETINGLITFSKATIQMIDAKTINGDITMAGSIQDVDAETVNGSITYKLRELTESGYADFSATTGSIHLFTPTNIRIEGKAKTNVGNFSIASQDSKIIEEKKEFVQKSVTFIGNEHASPRIKVNALTNTGSVIVKDLMS